MVKTFLEWKTAVADETAKLAPAQPYLTDEGRIRLRAFRILEDASVFCSSATEMLEYLADYKETCKRVEIPTNGSAIEIADARECKRALWDLQSHHISSCMSALKRIAKEEEVKN